jgi:methylenetetrahydrofolate reductase (NADPH)
MPDPVPPNPLQQALATPDRFVVSFELVPGCGPRGKDIEGILDFARKALAHPGLLDCLSLTDNVGGNVRISPDVLGHELREMGLEPLVHFSCKDLNRAFVISRAFQLERLGIRNLICLTGDAPVEGYRGRSKPTFDLDAVVLLDLLHEMNLGLPDPRNLSERAPPTHFFLGTAVSPYKKLEAELLTQYYKLHRKVRCGAHFVISQLGYDARKADELLRYMRLDPVLRDVPVMGDVYVLSRPVAATMHENKVPGCVVTKELLGRCEEWARGKDRRKRFQEFAARQLAILRGLGYHGAHLSGFNVSFDDVRAILETSRELQPKWRDFAREIRFAQEGEFYYFEPDPETGLNTDRPVDRRRTGHGGPHPGFRCMELFHALVFEPGRKGFGAAQALARQLDGSPRLRRFVAGLERLAKQVTSDCRECGDCALPDLAQLCPESQCGKFLRNGPCGGTTEGMCEVYPEKRCVYVRAYERLKGAGREESLRDMPLITRDWSLDHTSSWLNFYLGRDHHQVPTPWAPR